MQSFFTDTFEGRYIKSLLYNTPLPNYKTVREGDFIASQTYYVYRNRIIFCEEEGLVGTTAKYKEIRTYNLGDKNLLFTSNYISKYAYYDSETHERLGELLRSMRDIMHIDLMPLYNCYSAKFNALYTLNGTSIEKVKPTEFKVIEFPIKLNTTYTIAIDCDYAVNIKPVYVANENLLTVDDMDLTQMLYDAVPSSTQIRPSTQFLKPFTYRIDTSTLEQTHTNTVLSRFEDNLKLFIQLPIKNDSTVVVLEGDYSNKSHKHISQEHVGDYGGISSMPESKINELLFSNLSLLQMNSRVSYAFADTLFEYLIENTISNQTQIEKNVARVQDAISAGTYYPVVEDVWDVRLRKAIYDKMFYTKADNILGYVDKNASKAFTDPNFLRNTPEVNTYYSHMPAYLKLSSDSPITLSLNAKSGYHVEKSLDGKNWSKWNWSDETITGNEIYLRGVGNSAVTGYSGTGFGITCSSDVHLGGVAEALIDYNYIAVGVDPSYSPSAFNSLFSGCTQVVNTPLFITKKVSQGMYKEMFKGCTSLTDASPLSGVELDMMCYYGMFEGCTSLVTPPVLNPNALLKSTDTYENMFKGCTALTSIPEVSTKLRDSDDTEQYTSMFEGCTSLVDVSSFIMKEPLRYVATFKGCTSITAVPDITHTVVSGDAFCETFMGCTSLVTPPDMSHLTTVTDGHSTFARMFKGCTSLTSTPDLSNLTDVMAYPGYSPFASMFEGCTSLTSAFTINIDSLEEDYFSYTYSGCTSLKKLPKFNSTYYGNFSCQGMFANCSSVKVSTTQTGSYTEAYRIPVTGSGSDPGYGYDEEAFESALSGTSGSFTGSMTTNITYYLDIS